MEQPFLTLNNGISIPQLGLGTWQTPDHEAAACVATALEAGYRLIDTAAVYGNETGVGAGLKVSGLPRDRFFVTTKVWNDCHGYDATLRACEESLARLGLDYVDLYLIHWPAPRQDRYVDTWRALVRLLAEKRTRAIGVSNFEVAHLARVINETGVVPAINQIELHPDFQQRELQAFHREHGILTQSWSPLGQGTLLTHERVLKISRKHGRTPAQTVIRWHLDNNLLVIPKSVKAERIAANFAVFDFRLDAEDMTWLATLDHAGGRIGPHPETADF
ncbi:MAG: aldo/keto reductase [Zoogloeaceae bacterium]|jgi:2,5-diketo-D-gluconate reductase A|nr:aldo/keto reductase [Zoogloeaceae bacterium]